MSFMGLPVELRAQIIDTVLQHRQRRPDHPQSIRKRMPVNDHKGRAWWVASRILYESEPVAHSVISTNLLLVNRQVYTETSKQLERLNRQIQYELDIMINGDRKLIPTWTYLPTVSKSIESLSVSFRLFGTAKDVSGREKLWRESIAEPPPMSLYLYNLLDRFLKIGASAPRMSRFKGDYPIAINCLELNIERTVDTEPTCSMHPSCQQGLSMNLIQHGGVMAQEFFGPDLLYTWHPEAFHEFVCDNLENMLAMNHYTAGYGANLYSNIGKIKLSIDGCLVKEYDLGQILVDLPHGGPASTFAGQRGENFETWRGKTIQFRQSRGLRVPASLQP